MAKNKNNKKQKQTFKTADVQARGQKYKRDIRQNSALMFIVDAYEQKKMSLAFFVEVFLQLISLKCI